jgi:hypothetical protein
MGLDQNTALLMETRQQRDKAPFRLPAASRTTALVMMAR